MNLSIPWLVISIDPAPNPFGAFLAIRSKMRLLYGGLRCLLYSATMAEIAKAVTSLEGGTSTRNQVPVPDLPQMVLCVDHEVRRVSSPLLRSHPSSAVSSSAVTDAMANHSKSSGFVSSITTLRRGRDRYHRHPTRNKKTRRYVFLCRQSEQCRCR